jgi:hypothetical protein
MPECPNLTAPGKEGGDGVSQQMAKDWLVFSFSMNNSLE